MLIVRCFKRNFLLFLLSSFFVVVFTLEFFTYKLNTFQWNQLKCKTSQCTRILLVADPQLIGLRNEVLHLLTPITILDSDRYLYKTYSYAFDFSKPDIVIFLGDLLDEGSIATDEEFKSYLRRLFNIFLAEPFSSVKHIWIPGDNDIGGEGYDIVTEHKLKRFQQAFNQPDIIQFRNINFYKINVFLHTIPPFIDKKDFFNTSRLTVGLSHMPLLFHPSVFVDKTLSKLQPHVLFTAHTHKSMIVALDALVRTDRQIIPIMPEENKVYEYKLGSSDIYEIHIPTCSYRMGTLKIGYGLAVIENNDLSFTVLWAPSRFHQLIVYLIYSIICVLLIVFKNLISHKNTYLALRK